MKTDITDDGQSLRRLKVKLIENKGYKVSVAKKIIHLLVLLVNTAEDI